MSINGNSAVIEATQSVLIRCVSLLYHGQSGRELRQPDSVRFAKNRLPVTNKLFTIRHENEWLGRDTQNSHISCGNCTHKGTEIFVSFHHGGAAWALLSSGGVVHCLQ